MTSDLISISEASNRTGLSTEDIEYAEQSGLLAAGREAEGYYSPTQIRSLEGIVRLRQLGLSMEEIADLDLSEDILAEVKEHLGFSRAGKPSLELSSAFLRASIHVLRSHERVVDSQIEQLEMLKRSLHRKAGALWRLLEFLRERTRSAA